MEEINVTEFYAFIRDIKYMNEPIRHKYVSKMPLYALITLCALTSIFMKLFKSRESKDQKE